MFCKVFSNPIENIKNDHTLSQLFVITVRSVTIEFGVYFATFCAKVILSVFGTLDFYACHPCGFQGHKYEAAGCCLPNIAGHRWWLELPCNIR